MDEQREFNPYRAPQSDMTQNAPSVWRAEPRRVPAKNGLLWLREAGRLFAASPFLWISAPVRASWPVALLLLLSLPRQDPPAWSLLVWIFWPLIAARVALTAHRRREGAEAPGAGPDLDSFRVFLWLCFGFFVVLPGMCGLFSCNRAWLESVRFQEGGRFLFLLSSAVCALFATLLMLASAFVASAHILADRGAVVAWLRNVPAFLLNGVSMAPAALAALPLCLLATLCVGTFTLGRWPPSGILDIQLLLLPLHLAMFGYIALVAYAAVRDLFYDPDNAPDAAATRPEDAA